MASKMWVACYGEVDNLDGRQVEVPVLGSLLAVRVVDFGSGAAKADDVIPAGTRYVKLLPDTACHARLQLNSAAAGASTSDEPFAADLPEFRRVSYGQANGNWTVSAVARA